MLEHQLVEVDPAEPLHALRPAEQAEALRVLVDDGGVERAAAEVVDGDRGARLDALGRRVVQRGGLRLGQEHDGQAVAAQRGAEQVLLVRAPRRRVGDGQLRGRAALAAARPGPRPTAPAGPRAPRAPTAVRSRAPGWDRRSAA